MKNPAGKNPKKKKSASSSTREVKSMAATITANNDNGFTVTGANTIVVRTTLFTPNMGNRTCEYTVEFPAAEGPNMGSTLTRDTPEKNATIVVSSVLMTPKTLPLATFTGRRVTYDVQDPGGREVKVTIRATNTSGANQAWHHEFALVTPTAAGITFDVKKVSGNMTIDSVDVTL